MNLRRPELGVEYDPYYHGYVEQVIDNDFVFVLKNTLSKTISFMENIPLEKWNYRYAPDKWTIKEVIIHLLDTERVFTYRAMRIARNDKTPLAGFDQNDYVPFSDAENRSPQSIIDEYKTMRPSTIQLFQHFTSEQLNRLGTGSGKPISVLALGFLVVGHEAHHFKILEERYL